MPSRMWEVSCSQHQVLGKHEKNKKHILHVDSSKINISLLIFPKEKRILKSPSKNFYFFYQWTINNHFVTHFCQVKKINAKWKTKDFLPLPRSFALSERSTSTSSYSRMASSMILPSLLNKNSMGILMSSVSFPSPAIWNRGAVSLLLPSLSSSQRMNKSKDQNVHPLERSSCPSLLFFTCRH